MSTDHTSSSAMDTGTLTPHHHSITSHTVTLHSPVPSSPSTTLSVSVSTSTDTQLTLSTTRDSSHETVLSSSRSHDLSPDTSHDTVLSPDMSHDLPERSHDQVFERPQPVHLSRGGTVARGDTDRWTHMCSDEEQEQQRLEVYKENRRKRYQNALEEKLSTLPRTAYYSTTD